MSIKTDPTLAETRPTNWKALGIVFLVALLVRTAYLLTLDINDPIRADAQKYFLLAFNFLNYGVYSLGSIGSTLPLEPSTSITPGYPLFLALIMHFSHSFEGFVENTVMVQTIISSLSCALLFSIGQRFLPTKLAILCSALLILSPHSIILSGYVLTETVFIFACLLAVLVLCKSEETGNSGLYILAGLVFSLAVLIRPGLAFFPFMVAAILILRCESRDLAWAKSKKVALMLACFMATLGPWILWANANKGETENSPIAEQIALGSYPNLVHERESMRGFPYRDDPAFALMAKSVTATADTVTARIAEEPLRYLRWYLVGKPVMFHQANILVGQGGAFIYPVKRSLFDVSTVASTVYALMMRLHPLLVIFAALTSIVTLFRVTQRRAVPGFLALTLASAIFIYFTALHTVLAPLPRYSIPLHPFIYLLAIAGMAEASRRLGDLK